MVRKAIQKFHLNFFSADGPLSETAVKVISRLQRHHSILREKVRHGKVAAEVQGALKGLKCSFPCWGFIISGALEWCGRILLLLVSWGPLKMEIWISCTLPSNGNVPSGSVLREQVTIWKDTCRSGRQDWKPRNQAQFPNPPLSVKVSWIGFVSIWLISVFSQLMYPSSTLWHQAGTRWDQVKGVPAHHLTKGRVYPFSSNGGHKLTEPKHKKSFLSCNWVTERL